MDIDRDRWGRPLVPNPMPDGDPVWHHRASGIGNQIADMFNIQQWQKRMLIVGATKRQDLLALADTLDPYDKGDKQKLNRIATEMQEAAGSKDRANIGTALHSYTEQIDAGAKVEPLPQFVDDLNAYTACLVKHRIEIDPQWMERFVVWPDKRIAGSADRYAMWNGRMVVVDLKTGKSDPAAFSMISQATQLASYANATHAWDGETADPLPEIDTEVGLILWLPAGEGRAELIEVDLTEGARLVDLALDVYWSRKNKALGRTLPDPRTGQVETAAERGGGGLATAEVPPEAVTRPPISQLVDRLNILIEFTGCTRADVGASWPQGAPGLLADGHTDDTLARIDHMIDRLEWDHHLTQPEQADVDQSIARMRALPTDLLAGIGQLNKKLETPVPNPTIGTVTVAQLETLNEWIDGAEIEGQNRLAQLVNHMSPLSETDADAIIAYATETRDLPIPTATSDNLAELDNLEAERVMALAELHEAGVDDLVAHLVDVTGSKSKALTAGKQMAALHELPAPRSTAEIAEDRLLVALVTSTNNNKENNH